MSPYPLVDLPQMCEALMRALVGALDCLDEDDMSRVRATFEEHMPKLHEVAP